MSLFFCGADQFVILTPHRADGILFIAQGEGGDIVGIESRGVNQAGYADPLAISGDDVVGSVFVDAHHPVIESKFGTGRFRVGPERLYKGQRIYD